jgi:hypothetical protein
MIFAIYYDVKNSTCLSIEACDKKLEANANDKDSRPELCSGNQQK